MDKTKKKFLKKVEQAFLSENTVPLFKTFPNGFDWDLFSNSLSNSLNKDIIATVSNDVKWRKGQEITQGMDENCIFMSFSLAPNIGNVIWIMNEQDIDHITNKVFSEEQIEITSDVIKEGFYNYLCLESLFILEQLKFFSGISLKINQNIEVEEDVAFCMDININVMNKNFIGRLCIPPSFKEKWNDYYSSIENKSTKAPIYNDVDMFLNIEAGYTKLTKKEIGTLKEGDFVILDRIGINKKKKRSYVVLSLNGMALFHARMKQGKIKIIDYVEYEEEYKYMDINNQDNVEEEKEEENLPKEEFLQEEEIVVNKKLPQEIYSSIKDSPINLVVEIAKLRMSMDKLVNLQPGNFLELNTSVEESVGLSVNGKKVGKAQLVYIGEHMGLRIIEMGHNQ